MTFEWIRFALAAALVAIGLAVMVLSVFGVYRLRYVLNRMHAAALGDTLGILFVILGLIVAVGFTFTTLKLALIVICLWFSGPVSSHLISRLEVTINPEEHAEYESIHLPEAEQSKEEKQ